MQKDAFKEDISFEIMQHVLLVNFINRGKFKKNIVHINRIDMDTTIISLKAIYHTLRHIQYIQYITSLFSTSFCR